MALVVGASSGFGMGIARALLAEGVTVYAAARRLPPMQELAQAGAHLLSMDVAQDASVKEGIARILAEQGRIDIVLNNAGYGAYGALEAVPIEEAKRQFEVNIFGLARVNNAVLPSMRAQGSGRIIVTASLASHLSAPLAGWYTASKHALKALAETLRIELDGSGVKVVQIEPGPVQTQFEEVALNAMDRLQHPAQYQPLVAGVRRYLTRMYAKAPGPQSTVKAMLHAALAPEPRAVYRTTMEAKVLPLVRGLLGTALTGKLIRRVMLG